MRRNYEILDGHVMIFARKEFFSGEQLFRNYSRRTGMRTEHLEDIDIHGTGSSIDEMCKSAMEDLRRVVNTYKADVVVIRNESHPTKFREFIYNLFRYEGNYPYEATAELYRRN